MPSRGRWEESDQLLCLPETKSSPLVRLRGKFSVEFSERKKMVTGAWGPPENTSTDLRKLKRHLPKVVTQLGLWLWLLFFCPNQHKTLPFFYTQGQASFTQVPRSCQGRRWIWQCGNKRFFLKFIPCPINKKHRSWKMSFWRLVGMDSVWKWPPAEDQRGVAIVEKKDNH